MSDFIDTNPTVVVANVPGLPDGLRDVTEWLVHEFGEGSVHHAFNSGQGAWYGYRAMLLNNWADSAGHYVSVDIPDRSDRLLFILRWGNVK